MRDAQASTIYLKDYRVPDYLIDETELRFELFETHALVHSNLRFRRNPQSERLSAPLVLDGCELELKSLSIDNKALSESSYRLDEESLTIDSVPAEFTLQCTTRIEPQNNTSLDGLYRSSTMFCTQCEAEGFRKITYYLDRPDVMSVYTVTLEADAQTYPVLLSNGNLQRREALADGRQRAVWHDPHRKPAYLFALVAGDLERVSDSFLTCGGRKVDLHIYVEAKDLDKCDHAMQSLKHAMRWDEEVYGREYDLDIFNIVAVDDFNMGAMENKSLNIFNTSCVLASPETTTDVGFQRVEGVVAHEYFHNWSGNRVTCRDWFQLSLKEGFTVFRDTEFSSDMGSPIVKRVEDVSLLRTAQFAEDAGPMAHPVRPDSYMEISNFYTVTIYEKGAEVVRMIHTLLGPEKFRAGSDLYFERHDGQAVGCEEFVKAMEDASGIDLRQFRLWYSQAGTPQVKVAGQYDAQAQTYTLNVAQSCPDTPGQSNKKPFHIPLAMGLVGEAGSLPLTLRDAEPNTETTDNTYAVLNLTEASQQFVFTQVKERPVPSLFRGFSAPVKLRVDYSRDDLLFLMQNDSDGFNRWEASQQLGVLVLSDMVAAHQAGESLALDERVITAGRNLLADESLDPAMVALMLTLPSEAYMAEQMQPVDVLSIHNARNQARLELAMALRDDLLLAYRRLSMSQGRYAPSSEQIASRSLKNLALQYLMLLPGADVLPLCLTQLEDADNMTDRIAALAALVNSEHETETAKALKEFYESWKHEPLVVNQWFQVQACCQRPDTLARVRLLLEHPAFDSRNPNKIRSVVGAFCGQNAVNFHQVDGAGYRFLADQVIQLNRSNPQIASRLLGPLSKWRKFLPEQQSRMKAELERIAAEPKLSRDVFEIVSKSLQS